MKTIASSGRPSPRAKSSKQRRNSIELRTGIHGQERSNSQNSTTLSTISSKFTVNSASNVLLNVAKESPKQSPLPPAPSLPVPIPILTVCLPGETEEVRLQSRMNYQSYPVEYSSDERETSFINEPPDAVKSASKRRSAMSNRSYGSDKKLSDNESSSYEGHGRVNLRPLSNRSVMSNRSNSSARRSPMMPQNLNLNIETIAIVHHRQDSTSDSSDNPASPRTQYIPKVAVSKFSDDSDQGTSPKQKRKQKKIKPKASKVT